MLQTITQLNLPGLTNQLKLKDSMDSNSVNPGQRVKYMGDVTGGPPQGISGTIKTVESRRAFVDMGIHGNWYIPYMLLILSEAA